MEKSVSNSNSNSNMSWVIGSVKCGLLSFVIATAGVLLLALIAKLTTMSSNLLPVINQIIKGVAVAVGVMMCVRGEKVLLKAILSAVVFSVLNLILYLALGGQFNFGQFGMDLGIALAVAVVVSLIFGRKK